MKLIQFKKGWVTRDFVIAGILFSGVVGFFVLFIAGMAAEYNQPGLVSSTFSANYDKLNDIADKVETMRSTTSGGEGLSFVGTFDVAFSATFTVIQLVFSTLALMGSLPAKIITDFTFIDSTVVANFFVLGLAILTTSIIFIWISSISRGKI